MSESNASAISNPRAVSRTHKLTVTAMLSTVAFLLMFIEFPIPALIPAFVKLDISDLPELLAAFSLGPIYGVIVTLPMMKLKSSPTYADDVPCSTENSTFLSSVTITP